MAVLWYLLVGIAGIAIGFTGRCIYAKLKLTSAEQRAKVLEENASKNAEAKAKEIILETRDRLLKEQQQQESEARDRRAELQKSERRLQQKEENLERKQQENDSVTRQLGEMQPQEVQQNRAHGGFDAMSSGNAAAAMARMILNKKKGIPTPEPDEILENVKRINEEEKSNGSKSKNSQNDQNVSNRTQNYAGNH